MAFENSAPKVARVSNPRTGGGETSVLGLAVLVGLAVWFGWDWYWDYQFKGMNPGKKLETARTALSKASTDTGKIAAHTKYVQALDGCAGEQDARIASLSAAFAEYASATSRRLVEQNRRLADANARMASMTGRISELEKVKARLDIFEEAYPLPAEANPRRVASPPVPSFR